MIMNCLGKSNEEILKKLNRYSKSDLTKICTHLNIANIKTMKKMRREIVESLKKRRVKDIDGYLIKILYGVCSSSDE